MGIAPSNARRVRQQFVKASMIRKSGGCATTAFALTVGLEKDPSLKLRLQVVEFWLRVLAETTIPKEAIKRAWTRSNLELEGNPKRWLIVLGPMAAVIATMVGMRWQTWQADQWVDPDGNLWNLEPRQPGFLAKISTCIKEHCTVDKMTNII